MTYYQLNMFDNPGTCLSIFEKCISHGSGYAHGRIRIYAACIHLKGKDFIDFIKDEYGIGGFGDINVSVSYNAKGLSMRKWKEDNSTDYTWKQIAEEIIKLINLDLYLTEKDKEQIEVIKENHNGDLPLPNARYHYE